MTPLDAQAIEELTNLRARVAAAEKLATSEMATRDFMQGERDAARQELAEVKKNAGRYREEAQRQTVRADDKRRIALQAEEKMRKAAAEAARLREALIRLRDCDWVITPADRMDAVRDIARQALATPPAQGRGEI